MNDFLEDEGDYLDEEFFIEEDFVIVKFFEYFCISGLYIGEDYKDIDEEYGITNYNSFKEKLIVLEVKIIFEKVSDMIV